MGSDEWWCHLADTKDGWQLHKAAVSKFAESYIWRWQPADHVWQTDRADYCVVFSLLNESDPADVAHVLTDGVSSWYQCGWDQLTDGVSNWSTDGLSVNGWDVSVIRLMNGLTDSCREQLSAKGIGYTNYVADSCLRQLSINCWNREKATKRLI
jgi:hypothetical protein